MLDLRCAGVATRSFARMVDLVVQAVALVVLAMGSGFLAGLGVSATLLGLVDVVVVLLVLPIAVEVLTRGRSLGRAIFGLRVIGTDGSPVRARQSIVRGLLALVEVYMSLGFIAMVAAMVSPASQRLGDVAAATVVVREPRGHGARVPVAFFPPPGFEGYVSTLDVGRLGPDDFALLRAFLMRVSELSPSARWQRSVELAEGIRVAIGHDLPARVHPETWLVCVASAYQWRAGGLLRDVALGLATVAGPGVAPAPGRRTARRGATP